jgi:hypothetical protein
LENDETNAQTKSPVFLLWALLEKTWLVTSQPGKRSRWAIAPSKELKGENPGSD